MNNFLENRVERLWVKFFDLLVVFFLRLCLIFLFSVFLVYLFLCFFFRGLIKGFEKFLFKDMCFYSLEKKFVKLFFFGLLIVEFFRFILVCFWFFRWLLSNSLLLGFEGEYDEEKVDSGDDNDK